MAVLRRACSPEAEQSLRSHADVLGRLGELPSPVAFRALVPEIIAHGAAGSRGFLVESYLPGTTMETLLRDGEDPAQPLANAVEAVRPLHEAGAARRRVNEALLHDLVELPCERVRRAVARHPRLRDAVDRLEAELRAGLSGREVMTSWVHGDLSPSNILIDADRKVRGIVDWERGSMRGLPQLDLLQLLISARMTTEGRELGEVVAGMLRDPAWRPCEQGPAGALAALDSSIPLREQILLAWLAHVSANIGKSARYAKGRLWTRRNIHPVIATVAAQEAPALAPTPRPTRRIPVARLALPRPLRDSVAAKPLELASSVGPLGLATLLWLLSLPRIHPRAMTDFGLISVLPYTFGLALLVLTVSFVWQVHRRSLSTWSLVAHLLALVAFVHATPVLAYGTLRYEWAWKHVGIVDYIARHGAVDPAIRFLGVYHNWPGFFALITLLTRAAGLPDALTLAAWGPVFNNVLYLSALGFLFSGLTRDRRIVWLACWLFLIANWVGQDYFSPQAFAFLLYLVLLGVVVRWLGPSARPERPTRGAALALAVVVLCAIAPSHALTSVMSCIALSALVLARVSNVRGLPVIAIGITALWDLVFAWDFVSRNIASTLHEVNLPWDTTSSSLTNVGQLSPDQALVANLSRGLTAMIVLIAAAGALRQWRAGSLSRTAVVLAIAPLVLFGTGSYDGEILFRIYLFAVPFLAFLGAHTLVGHRHRAVSRLLTAVALTLVLGGFLVAYYGKERINYFTPQEVAAARYVDTHAPPDSLLIDGTNNYPYAFKNYERFVYVSIATEPPTSRSRVLADPAGVLAGWISDRSYRGGYVLITRSQKIDVEADGAMPAGSLDAIERALLSSPRFRVVYRNRDAIVFARGSVDR